MKEDYMRLLNTLAEATGVGTVEDDGEFVFTLQLDDILLHIEYLEETDECYLFSPVLSLVDFSSGKGKIYEELLHDNCLYRGTRGGILGVDRESGSVVYAVRLPVAGLLDDDFLTFVEAFVNFVEELQQKYREVLREGGAADESDASPMQNMTQRI